MPESRPLPLPDDPRGDPLADPLLRDDWHVAARLADLPPDRPLAVTLLGERLALWRQGDRVSAWKDLCVHRGAQLSLGRVTAGCLVCPYHGWTYDAEGACVLMPSQPDRAIPARAHAVTYRAVAHLGWVWVCLGEPRCDPPPFPEWADARFRTVHCGPYRFRAQGPRAVENFLDVAHLGFVHEGTLGEAGQTRIEDYEARVTPAGVVADDIAVWQPDPDGRGRGAHVHYRYEVLRPLTARLSKGFSGSRFGLLFAVTPVDEQTSDGWMVIAMDYDLDGWAQSDAEVRDFEDRVVAQDIPVVESQRPHLLPLDLQAEMNLRSDRLSIAYRRWLRDLGLRYGTA